MSLFGRFYRVFTFGQSHSKITGCVVEGFPSNFKVDLGHIQSELNRRKPGQSHISTPRNEKDSLDCVSGLEDGKTLGSPLCFVVANENVKKSDYDVFSNVPRPGHADLSYLNKYGIKASSGGGRSSARQTIGRVIAGALAKQYLKTKNISFASWVQRVENISIPSQINQTLIQRAISNQEVQDRGQIKLNQQGFLFKDLSQTLLFDKTKKVFSNVDLDFSKAEFMANTRCPHFQTSLKIYERICEIKEEKDSLGGVIQGCIYNLPKGLGQPVFDKIQALLAHAMLSIPATKGFQFGSGFEGTKMKGSEHNDLFNVDLSLKSNHSGGSLGGITTGQTFYFQVAFKPVSTISKPQTTSTYNGKEVILEGKGRHDPCVLPRATPIVDNMAAMVIMDLMLAHQSRID